MTKIAINGFGRIGRPTFRRIFDKHPNLKIVAINDLTDNQTLAHLLKYDSLYGIYDKEIGWTEKSLKVDGQEFRVFEETEPANLPWKDLGVDVVLECTGRFTDLEGAKKHLTAGAKKVIISAPCKSPDVPTFVLGVNQEKYDPAKDSLVSMGSCTTNCLGPVAKVLHDAFQIEKGLMTTVHSYTNDQRLLDLPHKDLRRTRAAAVNIIPTTTGAAQSVIRTIPELEGKIDGIAMRVPTATVSVVDFIALVAKATDVNEVNQIFKKEAAGKLQGILGVTEESLVSMDFKGDSRSAIVDLPLTMVKDNLVKVVAWYDNEWGYACRLAEFAEFVGTKL